MKTLPLIAFLAALGALLLGSLSLETSTMLLVASGFFAMFAADYAHAGGRRSRRAFAVAVTTDGATQLSRFRLAA